MNAVERPVKDHISLNGYKTVDRSALPPHWDDAFIQDLARRPGWIRYYPFGTFANSPDETKIEGMMHNWIMWNEALVDALELVRRTADDEMQEESAINGIRHAFRTMIDEFRDIAEFTHRTTGKWEEPAPAKDLRPVEVAP